MTEDELKTKTCPHITGPYEHQRYDPMTGSPRIDILVVTGGSSCIGSACSQYRETTYPDGPIKQGSAYCGLAGKP